MANSPIKAPLHLGVWEEKSLPFTAPSDGYVYVFSNPNASNASDVIGVNGEYSIGGIINRSPSGNSVGGMTAVCRGDSIDLYTSSVNIGSRKVYFKPILGG